MLLPLSPGMGQKTMKNHGDKRVIMGKKMESQADARHRFDDARRPGSSVGRAED